VIIRRKYILFEKYFWNICMIDLPNTIPSKIFNPIYQIQYFKNIMTDMVCISIHRINIFRLRLYEFENQTRNKNNGNAILQTNLKIVISGKK